MQKHSPASVLVIYQNQPRYFAIRVPFTPSPPLSLFLLFFYNQAFNKASIIHVKMEKGTNWNHADIRSSKSKVDFHDTSN